MSLARQYQDLVASQAEVEHLITESTGPTCTGERGRLPAPRPRRSAVTCPVCRERGGSGDWLDSFVSVVRCRVTASRQPRVGARTADQLTDRAVMRPQAGAHSESITDNRASSDLIQWSDLSYQNPSDCWLPQAVMRRGSSNEPRMNPKPRLSRYRFRKVGICTIPYICVILCVCATYKVHGIPLHRKAQTPWFCTVPCFRLGLTDTARLRSEKGFIR